MALGLPAAYALARHRSFLNRVAIGWVLVSQVFPVKAEVRKTREIYRFQGVQIHLDTVKGLGKFLEFEKVLAAESERGEGRKHLEALRGYFQIPDEDLMASSYSDFLESE